MCAQFLQQQTTGSFTEVRSLIADLIAEVVIFLDQDDIRMLAPIAWKMLLDCDGGVSSARVRGFVLLLVHCAENAPSLVQRLIFDEFYSPDPQIRANALLRFKMLWRERSAAIKQYVSMFPREVPLPQIISTSEEHPILPVRWWTTVCVRNALACNIPALVEEQTTLLGLLPVVLTTSSLFVVDMCLDDHPSVYFQAREILDECFATDPHIFLYILTEPLCFWSTRPGTDSAQPVRDLTLRLELLQRHVPRMAAFVRNLATAEHSEPASESASQQQPMSNSSSHLMS